MVRMAHVSKKCDLLRQLQHWWDLPSTILQCHVTRKPGQVLCVEVLRQWLSSTTPASCLGNLDGGAIASTFVALSQDELTMMGKQAIKSRREDRGDDSDDEDDTGFQEI